MGSSGPDFWPGEYSKTYVNATKDYAVILDGLRNGRIFVTLGDLIDRLDLTVTAGGRTAAVGETLRLGGRERDAEVEVRVRVPPTRNGKGERPVPARIDVITGRVTGPAADRASDTNPATLVAGCYGPGRWHRDGDEIVVRHTVRDVDGPMYVRVRGTRHQHHRPRTCPGRPWRRPLGRPLVLLQPHLPRPLTRVAVLPPSTGKGLSWRRRRSRPQDGFP